MPDFAELDHYELLGVARNATDAEITAAYDRKWKQVRPDRNPAAHELGISLNSARSTLLDINRRREYDESLPPERGREERERREREGREREEQERNRREQERREREEREREERERRRREQERREREERERGERERRRRERERREHEEREREEQEREDRERRRRERERREREERERHRRERERQERERRERVAVAGMKYGLRLTALLIAATAIVVGAAGSVLGLEPSWIPLPFTIFPAIATLGSILLVATMRVPTAEGASPIILIATVLGYLLTTNNFEELHNIYSFGGHWYNDSTGLRGLLAYPAVVIDAQLDASAHQYGALPAICVGIIICGFWRMGMERQSKDEASSQNPIARQRLLSLTEARSTALASFGWSAIIAPISYATLQTVAFFLFLIFFGIPFSIVDIFADISFGPILDGDAWNLWIVVVTGCAAFACGVASGSVPRLIDQLLRRVVRNGERTRDWLTSGSLMAVALAPSAVIFILIALGGLYWEPILEPLIEWTYS